MKSFFKIAMMLGLAAAAVSCHNKQEPNYQYFPNMYQSVAYETYSESKAFRGDGREGLIPPANTLKRGHEVYEFPNTEEGKLASRGNTPKDSSAVDMDKAKQLFDIYCGICHGDAGDGKGNLAKREKFAGVPSYKDRDITLGSVFHVETYGLNSMGSYANQLSQQERWMVASYVMKLKSELK